MTLLKKLRDGAQLHAVSNISGTIESAIEQATLFLSDYCGFKSTSMTDCRIQSWIQKKRTTAFIENVKRAHFQAIIYSTMEAIPPDIDPTAYGWQRDMENRILSPVGFLDNIAAAMWLVV